MRLSFLILLFLSSVFIKAAEGRSRFSERETDSVMARYLSNNTNTADKICELLDVIKSTDGTSLKDDNVTFLYQIALSLAPYAKDSASVLSRLYLMFGRELYMVGASRLAIDNMKTGYLYKNNRIRPLA